MPADSPPTLAPTALVRAKTSDAVAEHILELIFTGELAPGDRIPLDPIADRLGVSRVPVREALMALERDGLIEMPYHRGAFVAAFDAAAIREAFDLYALLNGLTSGRVAEQADAELLAGLEQLVGEVAAAEDDRDFERAAREFRRLINLAAAGPRLRATLRGFGGLLPVASRLSIDRSLAEERDLIVRELDAIRARDVAGAQAAAIEHIQLLGEYAVQTLTRRGVIAQTSGDTSADPAQLATLLHIVKRGERP